MLRCCSEGINIKNKTKQKDTTHKKTPNKLKGLSLIVSWVRKAEAHLGHAAFPITCWGWEGLCTRRYLLLIPADKFSMKYSSNGKCHFTENAVSYGRVSWKFVSEKDGVSTETKLEDSGLN